MKKSSAVAAVYAFTALNAAVALATPTLTTLVTFTGATGNLGSMPEAGLTADASGNFYGTTEDGGGGAEAGTVFKLTAGTHAFSTILAFNVTNGGYPEGGVLVNSSGNLYGTTNVGGSGFYGTVFEIAAGTNTLSTLANFNTTNGAYPSGSLLADASRNLYGTTISGGSSSDGTVFKIAVGTNTLSTLATFNYSNGSQPNGGLVADALGNLYGTTGGGGSGSDGTVFKIAVGTHALSTLATFNGANGSSPVGLIADASGNLYGETQGGGGSSSAKGTVFEIAAGTNTITTLVTFNVSNGAGAQGGLTFDASGNLYGMTEEGGSSGDGTIFEVANGTDTINTLATFDRTNGMYPFGGLIADAAGDLYGTTSAGGSSGDGTVFELSGTGFAVPEPGSLTLIGVGCVALLRRRRRHG